jgi:predicted membrane channel-forming protein YqfA (hemolysin III family)
MDDQLQKERLIWLTMVWALVSPIKLLTTSDHLSWITLTICSGIFLTAAWLHYFRKPTPDNPESTTI